MRDKMQVNFNPQIPGYDFEWVPTPLSAGGVGMYIKQGHNYRILERISSEAYQALWVELMFENKKNIVCGVLYRQHNSPDEFLKYVETKLETFSMNNKTIDRFTT